MPSDDQRKPKLDLGEDLDLSGLDDEQERQRQRKLASIPERVERSPLLRKVIGGRRAPGREGQGGEGDETPPAGDPEEEHGGAATLPPPEAASEARGGLDLSEIVAEPQKVPESGPEVRPAGTGSSATSPSGHPAGVSRRRRRSGPDAEEAWTGSRGTLWWLLAGMGVVVVIAFFLFREFQGSGRSEPLGTPYRPPETASVEDSPMGDFVMQSTDLLPPVRELVSRWDAMEEGEGAELFRGGKQALARMKAWHQRAPELPKFDLEAHHDLHASATLGTAYLTLDGWRSDYTRGLVYLLELDGRYLIDWEATVGYSEVLPEEVPELRDEESRLMRCVVRRSLYYTPAYPEDEFMCYALHHRDPSVFTWAYVKRGTAEAAAMQAHMAFNLRHPISGRATLRVRKAKAGARPNQVEVVEYLYAGWVRPEGDGAGSGLENEAGE